ncbi:hypothetical protein [Kitasatospora sp. NPDC057015]|uniref:hypothetical protein n=1 Tax=Kitasatospora sp. NPDC057015 TaxID=3346001 RepID=UPI00363001D3
MEGLTAMAAAGGAGVVQAAGTDAWTTLRARVARLLGRGRQDAEEAALERLGRTRQAAELHAFAVEGLARRLGDDHPDTRAAGDRRTIDRHIETQPI